MRVVRNALIDIHFNEDERELAEQLRDYLVGLGLSYNDESDSGSEEHENCLQLINTELFPDIKDYKKGLRGLAYHLII